MPTLTDEQYDALVALALEGATTPSRKRDVAAFVEVIDKANEINRYVLWVQWQEIDSEVPAGVRFPDTWPPEMRKKIERRDRPIGKADVDTVLAQYARRPTNVLVTIDVGGVLAWTAVADYFRNP